MCWEIFGGILARLIRYKIQQVFKKIFSDSLIYAIGPQLPKLIGVFLLPVLTKYLTADDYAIWGIATAYIAAMYTFRDLGLTQVLVNFFFRYPEQEKRWKSVWRQILGLLTIWGGVHGLILGIILYISLGDRVGDNIWMLLFYTVTPAIFFDIISIYGFRYYQFRQKPIPTAIASVISGIISLVVNYIAVVYFNMQYMSFFMGMFAASAFNAMYFFYPVIIKQDLLPILKINFKRLKPHLSIGLPLIPHNASAYLLGASDRVILDLYRQPLNQIGQYNFAYNFGNYADLVGNAIGTAVGPFYIKLYALRNEIAEMQVKVLTFLLQGLFIFFSVLFTIWCKELLDLLSSNEELAACYPYAIIIVMSYSYRPMYWACVNKLGYEEKTTQLWKISFIGGIINVILNIIFIPIYGIYAVVISTFIGLMYIGFSGFFLKAFKMHNNQSYYPLYWLVLIITLTIGVFLVKDFSINSKLIITCMMFILASLLLVKNKKTLILLK